MDKNLGQKVFTEATKGGGNSNITALAAELDLPVSSLYHHMFNNRSWRVEDWLGALYKLGIVELGKKGAYIRSKELVKALKRVG